MSINAGTLRVSHASGLHSVARELGELHRDMLRNSGIDGSAVRLSVLNLVSACVDVASADLASQVVGRVAERHPLRAIIILAEPDRPNGIEADLSLQCSIAGGGQVCAEQVLLNVAGEPAFHLASVVTPLLVPDIPVYLWLVGAPPIRQAFGLDAVAICERLIIDSGAYDDVPGTLRTLADELHNTGDAVAISDMAWERTVVWRRLIAQSFDGEEMRRFLHHIDRVDVECSGDEVSAQGWLLAGWLGSRLHWTRPPRIVGGARPIDGIDDHDLVRVVLRCRRDDRVATVAVHRQPGALHVQIEIEGGLRVDRTVPYVAPETVDMVGELLESSEGDAVYREALTAAATLAGGDP